MQTTKILIVEDEALIAEEISDALEHLGHTVLGIVDTAEAAVAAVLKEAPGLVLMDIRLKGQEDGVDAAWVIGEHTKVPVVFMTAHSDEATLDRAYLTRPFGYVVKPVREVDLATAVQTALLRATVENRLREGNAQHQVLIEQSTDLLLRVSAGGQVLAANPAFRKALGYTPPQLTRMWLVDLVPEPDRNALYDAVFRPGDTGTRSPRVALIKKDGGTIHATAIASQQVAADDASAVWIIFEPTVDS